jgi:transposase
MADALGPLYADERFADLFPRRGPPVEAPGRLAWVTVLQFVEDWSDRAVADAVRGRLDWNYWLGLELTDPGFDHTVLSEFRSRRGAGQAEQRLLDGLLTQWQERGLLKADGRQRTDSTPILAAVRDLNRLERVGETRRAALNSGAAVAPDGWQACAPPAWYERYGRRIENDPWPKTDAARQALAALIGTEGRWLLNAIDAATEQGWLGKVPAVQTLRRVWTEQYLEVEGARVWRAVNDRPSPAEWIASPDDPEARYSTQRSVEGVGYPVHRTETCDPAAPRLMVTVETTPATTPDDNRGAVVHASLAPRNRLPAEHLVDKGYPSAPVLLDSPRDYHGVIVGPVADDPSGPARAGEGFDKAHFQIDGDRQVATGPAGQQSGSCCRKPRSPGSWQRPVSRRKSARRVRTAPTAPDQRKSLVSSAYKNATRMKRYRPRARFRPPRRFVNSTQPAPGLKVPTSKPSGAVVCDSVATLDRPKPTGNTSSLPSPLTWSGSATGWQGHP